MIAFLRRNWEYKLLSLVLAVLLYVIASTQRNPSRTSSVTVQPEVVGLAANLAVKVPPKAEPVTLTGPTDELELVRKSGLRATVNASGAGPGKSFLSVAYVLPEAARGRVAVEARPTIEVELEARIEKEVPVRVLFENQPPAGFIYQAPKAEPSRVKVTGLASEVERVERVVALLDNSERVGVVDRDVPVVAQNDRQQVVSSVTLTPTRVHVALALRQSPATKTLVVSADLTGKTAPGTALTGYLFEPGTIVVQGDPTVLSKLSTFSIPVDVAGLAKNEIRQVTLKTPAGVRLMGAPTTQLTLRVMQLTPATNTEGGEKKPLVGQKKKER